MKNSGRIMKQAALAMAIASLWMTPIHALEIIPDPSSPDPSVPVARPLAVAPDPGQVHVVANGETLSEIAARYGVSWRELARINNLRNPDRLSIGDTLVIRPPGAPRARPAHEAGVTARILELGDRPETIATVTGFGQDVPLHMAARMIVPSDWTVHLGPDMDEHRNTLVSWTGGRPWTVTLSEVAGSAKVRVMGINWREQTVQMSPSASSAMQGFARDAATAQSAEGPRVEPIPVIPMKTYELRRGSYLSDELERLGKREGWEIQWRIPMDYLIERELEIEAVSFDGFLEQIVRIYRESGAFRDVRIVASRVNRVVSFNQEGRS